MENFRREQFELPKDLPVPAATLLKLGAAACFHPLEYSKVLIQIGHEPVAPRSTRTLFGKPALALPSVFQYCGHIRKRDGFLGLWRGLTPRLCSVAVSTYTSQKFNELVPPEPSLTEEEEENLTEEEKRQRFVKSTLREAANKIACIIMSQPLQVIAIRSMAQFVGGEDKYSGVFGGILSVWEESGLAGFWSGVVPRCLGEVSVLGITATLTFLVNTYVLDDKEMRTYTGHVAGFLASSLCYPFQVVSTCMAVSRSGLMAGYPPYMPLYAGWTDCFSDLRERNQLKRGASLIFRYYTGPQVIVGDRMVRVSSGMFQAPAKKE